MNAARLRELAARATPGPWYVEIEPPESMLRTRVGSEGHRRGVGDYAFVVLDAEVGDDQAPVEFDATYIAAVSPDVVVGLLDEIDRLRGEA